MKIAVVYNMESQKVTIVGEFNNWDREATPLKKQKDGSRAVTLELEPGREYRYRYLIDDICWENDWFADRYEPNPFGCDDSVVKVQPEGGLFMNTEGAIGIRG